MLKQTKLYLTGLSFFVLMMVTLLGYISGKSAALNRLNGQLNTHSLEIKKQLEFELERFSNFSTVYSNNQQIRRFMSSSQQQSTLISEFLIEIATTSNALDAYLLSPQGTVVASSNYQQADSFVGNDFSFRDYFKQALTTGSGFELAVGMVSNKRGIYFSHAIKNEQQTIGVLVIKADVAAMEQRETLFPHNDFSFMLQSAQQTVFLSDQPSWRLKRFSQVESLQEGDNLLTKDPVKRWQQAGFDLWTINLPHAQQYLIFRDDFEQYPWQLKVLGKDQSSTSYGLLMAFISGIVFVSLLFLMLLFYERRKNNRRLQLSHQRLTEQVALRTADLTATNEQLRHEVEQRTQAEADLIATQEQLIQAAKLATIGELSSSINHEINQPIAALSSYLQLTEKMLEKKMFDKAGTNIANMHQLIERLVAIVSQFKNFSRKTNEPLQQVCLRQIVDNAIAIAGHHIQQHQVTLKLKPCKQELMVTAEPIQLEQVVINLLTNAVDALVDVDQPTISIRLFVDQQVVLEISDNGPGIEPHYLNKIFEPFFTTKSVSGLGLGLSISRRIIESFNGDLVVDNLASGGAVFQIRF